MACPTSSCCGKFLCIVTGLCKMPSGAFCKESQQVKEAARLAVPVSINILMTLFAWIYIYEMKTDDRMTAIFLHDNTTTGNNVVDGMLNGILSLLVLAAVSFSMLLLALYDFRRVVQLWLYASCVLLLFVVSGAFFYDVIEVFYPDFKWETVHIIILGIWISIYGSFGCYAFFCSTAPRSLHQAYVLANCSLVSLFYLRSFPGHTTWFVLAAIVFWDLFAVLAPMGPLRKVQEKAGDYSSNVLRFLMFSTDAKATNDRDASESLEDDEDMYDKEPRKFLWRDEVVQYDDEEKHPMVTKVKETFDDNFEDEDYEDEEDEDSEEESEEEEFEEDEIDEEEEDDEDYSDDSDEGEYHLEDEKEVDQKVQISRIESRTMAEDDGNTVRRRRLAAGMERRNIKAEQNMTTGIEELRRRINAVRANIEKSEEEKEEEEEEESDGTEDSSEDSDSDEEDENEKEKCFHETTAADALNDTESLRLGMGDFVFYGVLVGKAAASGSILGTCMAAIGVVYGLFFTLVCLANGDETVPALPASIILGSVLHCLGYYTETFLLSLF